MATGQRPNEGRFTRRRSPQNVTAPRQGQRFWPLVRTATSATDYGASAQNANKIAQDNWWGAVTEVTGTMAVTLEDATSAITASHTQTDDFTFTNADGSQWGPGWTFTQGTGDINSNRGRMVTGTSGFAGVSARYDTGTVDVSIRIDVEIPTNDAQFPELRLRYDSTNQDYVRLLFEPHNDTVYLHSYDNDVQQGLLDSASFAIAANDVVHIRAVMVGTSHLIRLWLNADPEPSTWQLEATTSFGAGNDQLMIRTVTSNLGVAITNYWDNFSFAPAVSGTIANTLDAATSSIAGDVVSEISGTMAVTLADATSTITGTEVFTGTIAVTLADATSSITGTEVFTGTIAVTTDDATSSITATETIPGTIANTLADATSTITGDVINPVTGTIAVTLADATSSITGTETISGSIAVTLADATSSITATETISGTIAATLADATSSITGTATDGEISEPFASTPDWTVLTGTFTVASGTLRPGSTATDCNAAFNELMLTNDCFVQADFITSSDTTDVYASLIGRWNGADINGTSCSAYVLQQNFADLVLYSVTSGPTFNTLATFSNTFATPGTYTVKLLIVGSTIQAYVNGVLQGSYTDTAVTTGKYVGVNMYSATAVTDTQLDNFQAGYASLTITGTIAATLADATSSITGTETISGTIAVTLDNATSSITGTGTTTITGTIAVTTEDATSAISGSSVGPFIDGTIDVVAADATSSIEGSLAYIISGTMAAVLEDAYCSVHGGQRGGRPVQFYPPGPIPTRIASRRRYYREHLNDDTGP